MPAPKAPVLGGTTKKEHALDESVFAAEVKPHLVHEAVRAEANARRAGTSKTKSRGMVAGGRSKPWRQKGTGKARAGTIRAPQFEGGGHAFAKAPRTFHQKVNRKVAKAALRSALASHANGGTLALVDVAKFETPSTKQAASLVETLARPIVLVCTGDEASLGRSFRNLDRVAVVDPAEVEVGAIVWARSLLVTEAALSVLEGEGEVVEPGQIVLAPIVSEKSYGGTADGKYTFRVHQDAHRTQVRQAVESLFDVKVARVNILKVQPKPKRRGQIKGTKQGWKKAIVQLQAGHTIEFFEGAQI